jgi:uncharacterized protein (TIGR00251 family)
MKAPRPGNTGVRETGCRIGVRIKPGASRERIVSAGDEGICIAVTAPPVEGKANEALVRFLAKTLGIKKSAVVVRTGLASRNKVVEIAGMTKQNVVERLKETSNG